MNIEQIAQEVREEMAGVILPQVVGAYEEAFLRRCLSKLAEQDVEPVAYTNEAQLGYVTSGQHPDIPLAMWSCNTSYASASIKLYTEAQLLAAQQRTAKACSKAVFEQAKYFGYNVHAEAVRDAALNNWREYL